MKKFLKIVAPVVLAAAVVLVSFVGYTPRDVYDAAVEAMKQGDYEMARSHLERLDSDSAANLLKELYFVPSRVATTYEDGTTQLQSYAYNRKGSLVKAELTENEMLVSTSAYTYTEAGGLLSMELLLPEQERPETTVNCFYDEWGNLTCSRTFGDEGLFYQTTYTYDPTGRCIASFYVNGTGDWERTEFTYDEAGRIATQTGTTNDQNDWYINRYAYYEDGQVKTERFQTPKELTVNLYDQDGKCRTSTVTTAEGDKTTQVYTYNDQGLVEQVSYSDGRAVLYQYDKSGKVLYTLDQGADGAREEMVQEYNQKGLLVKRQVTVSNANNQYSTTEIFKYNKKNLCVSYQYKNDTTGEWCQYTYAYDRHGNVEQETYEAETGSYERTYKWKTRHYPDGIPQMIEDVLQEYAVKNK